jgi:hypothetical protein
MGFSLRVAGSAFGLALCLGCSLLAPSKDDIAGGAVNPGGGGSTVGGSGGASGSAGSATGGQSGGTSGAAGAAGSAGTGGTGGSAGASLLFGDEFDADNSEWQFAGETGWNTSGGQAIQGNAAATYAVRWLPSLANLSDYRIEVRAKTTAPSNGAIQVLFRQTADASFYYCSFHPSLGEMFWGIYTTNWDSVELGTAPTFAVDYDPNQTFTMTLIANGPQFTCRVEEIPEAIASLYDTTYPEGSPGLKTYVATVAYDYLRVYSE